MKFIVLIICLVVVVEGRYNRRYNNLRHGNNFSYNFNNRFDSNQVTCNNFIDRILGPGDDIGAANGGVVIPPRGCIITWEEYESIVVNNKWLGIYLIDDDASLNPEFTWNFKVTWTSTGTNTYRRLGNFWNSLTNKCQTIDAMFMRDDPQLAISQFVSGGAFASADRRDYFVSCDPSQYIIFYICYVNPVNGRCPMSETILLIPDRRPEDSSKPTGRQGNISLDDIPWSKIEYDFSRCLRHLFVDHTDPQLITGWRFTECPEVMP